MLERLISEVIPFGTWFGLWAIGGIWMVKAAFRLRSHEIVLCGVAAGFIIENILANMLGQFLIVPTAFWFSALLVFCTGLAILLTKEPVNSIWKIPAYPGQWIAGFLLIYIFTGIGRGLAIFDDYAHLPTTSLLATGNIPPSFALDPGIPYGYHYFLMLFASQLMRIADVFPWTALDISRGFTFGIGIVLAGIWTQRLTRRMLGGWFGSFMYMFAMGTRWLLLLLPAGILLKISKNIQMIGSGAYSGPNLATALLGSWAIEGAGPIDFPFAFVNGILNPGVMRHGANSMTGIIVTLLVLLTFNRWRDWRGAAVTVLLIASGGLQGEVGFVMGILSWSTLTIIFILQNKSFRLPKKLWTWWIVLLLGWTLASLQGGAISDLLKGTINQNLLGQEIESYQTVGFQMVWPPTIVSSHLGVLSTGNIWQLITGLFEIGPVILVLPLMAFWGIKAYRTERWYEAAIMISAGISLLLFFVQFTGSTGVRNTSRLYSFVGTCWMWAAPLTWIWALGRRDIIKGIILGLVLIAAIGGIVLFAVQLPAIQKPVYSYFVTELDARMQNQYWNQLEPDTVIFDPTPSRAPTLFGRPTNSSTTWFDRKPTWEGLYKQPDPVALNQAGFDYAYLDSIYFEALDPEIQDSLRSECVTIVQEETSKMAHEYRLLLDIQSCKK